MVDWISCLSENQLSYSSYLWPGLEINGCPRHRDFAPGTEVSEARCPAGIGQKRLSSRPDIYLGTKILGRAPTFFNLGARQASAKKRLSSSPIWPRDPPLNLLSDFLVQYYLLVVILSHRQLSHALRFWNDSCLTELEQPSTHLSSLLASPLYGFTFNDTDL